jgi:hypothetical protein
LAALTLVKFPTGIDGICPEVSSHRTHRWREMDSNFWFPTDVDLFCRPFLCRANSRDGWAYRGGAPPQDCLYTPTNSVENSLPSLSTTLAKGDPDVPVSPTHRWLAAGRDTGSIGCESDIWAVTAATACMPPILCGSGPASKAAAPSRKDPRSSVHISLSVFMFRRKCRKTVARARSFPAARHHATKLTKVLRAGSADRQGVPLLDGELPVGGALLCSKSLRQRLAAPLLVALGLGDRTR